jgi:hypothetical protein
VVVADKVQGGRFGRRHLHRAARRVEALHGYLLQVQQTVLAESRDRDYFIGSNSKGYYLIDSIDDAIAMRDFYEERIRAE